MTGADALTGMAAVFDACAAAARAAAKEATAKENLSRLADAMAAMERRAQQDFAALLRRPLPLPDANRPGRWTRGMTASRATMAAASGVEAPGWIEQEFTEAETVANEWRAFAEATPDQRDAIVRQMSGGEQAMAADGQPGAAEFSGPGAVVAGAALSKAPGLWGIPPRVLGAAGITVGNIAIQVFSTYMASRAEKKAAFDDEDKPKQHRKKAEPATIEAAAQRALDQEMPGAMFALEQMPGGRWVASVRRGMDVVARRTAKTAEEASGDAVQAAIDKTLKAEGPVVDAEYVVLPPEAPKAAEAQRAG